MHRFSNLNRVSETNQILSKPTEFEIISENKLAIIIRLDVCSQSNVSNPLSIGGFVIEQS